MQIDGLFSADTFFINKNVKKYDLVIGMYHDQVLTPIKTLFALRQLIHHWPSIYKNKSRPWT